MSLFTKIFKGISGKADDTVKSTRRKAAEATADIKDFETGGVKTTSAIGSQGSSSFTRGGQQVVKAAAKGTDTSAKVGNKVIRAGAYTAVAAIPALGAVGLGKAGLGLYNDYKTSASLTPEDRRDRQVGKDYLDFLSGLQGLGMNVRDTSGNPNVDNNPTSMGNTGIGGSAAYNPYAQQDTEGSTSGGFGMLGIAGIVLLGAGGYYFLKKRKAQTASKS